MKASSVKYKLGPATTPPQRWWRDYIIGGFCMQRLFKPEWADMLTRRL